MSNDPYHGAMDLAERREADRRISQARREARRDYERYAEQAADADLDYRKTKARRMVELRAEGEPSGVAEVRAEAEAGEHRHRRDIAASLAKAALLRVDEAERDATVVRDLHRSSERVEGLAA